MCYFPAGNGEAEVKDNNERVGEGRRWRTRKERRERRENKQHPDRDKVSGRRRCEAVWAQAVQIH